MGHVICRQLGYSHAQQVFTQVMFGQLEGPVLIEQIRCKGNESLVSQCTIMAINERSSLWYYFHRSNGAGVLCVESQVELSQGGYLRKWMTWTMNCEVSNVIQHILSKTYRLCHANEPRPYTGETALRDCLLPARVIYCCVHAYGDTPQGW